MPYGSTNGGGPGLGGVPGNKPIGSGYGGGRMEIRKTKPTYENKKSISYNETQSEQIFAVTSSLTAIKNTRVLVCGTPYFTELRTLDATSYPMFSNVFCILL